MAESQPEESSKTSSVCPDAFPVNKMEPSGLAVKPAAGVELVPLGFNHTAAAGVSQPSEWRFTKSAANRRQPSNSSGGETPRLNVTATAERSSFICRCNCA